MQSLNNPFSLEGESALITGGGSGLGFGIAKSMIDAGARVTIVGRREVVLADAAETLGKSASYMVHDVCKRESARALVEQIGDLSILVNNAGVHLKKPLVETTPEEFDQVLLTHVAAAQALTRAVVPGMQRRGGGSVLFVASMTALIGMPSVVAYSAAKSALVGMTRSLTAELAGEGVRVNAIAPGWIDSPMLHQALQGDDARKNKILGRTPMGRFGDPDDIGNAAVYLCSSAAKFVSGVVLPVDGGASIGF
ncbi:MAG: SDR family oxidoreductase [Verrucomicrobiota bacterium]